MFDNQDTWIKYVVPVHTPEWYQFRTTGTEYYEGGIGASEISKFIGRNKYAPVAPEVYYQKIGMMSISRVYNEAIHWGIVMEKHIKDVWQYEDFDKRDGGWAKNYGMFQETGDLSYKIRDQKDAGYYLVNKKYPWLFASLDGVIPPNTKMVRPDGKGFADLHTPKHAPLEIKAMASYSLRQWDGNMDPGYIAQVHQQMLITESPYGEIGVLEDGRKLTIFPVYFNEELGDQILRVSYRVWHQMVLPGRELWRQYKEHASAGRRAKCEEIFSIMQSMEPEVTAGEAYEDFLKKEIKDPGARTQGSIKHYQLARKFKKVKALIKILEDEASLIQNTLLNEMRLKNIGQLDLGKDSRVSYSKKSGRFSVKGIPTPKFNSIQEILK